MKLKHAIIFAKDMERMTRFYRDGLGFRLLDERSSADWSEFDGGLALHAIPPNIAARIAISTPPQARSETPIKLVFDVADVEAARAQLVQHGAVMQEPKSWGGCDGLDPEGNVFQILKA
jgi:catechol 2,3-dioxygenase-like lactoylglutathione lyase family enzyme